MSTFDENLLQTRLEALEAGAPLTQILTDIPAEEAELLRLAASLRTMEAPERVTAQITAQRSAILSLAEQQTFVPHASVETPWQAMLTWLLGHKQLVVAASTVAVLLLVIGLWPRAKTAVSTETASSSAVTSAVPESNQSVGVSPADTTSDTVADATADTAADTAVPAAAETYASFLPSVHVAVVQDAQHATLLQPMGLVEVQDEDGVWTAVSRNITLSTGQRVRTGTLSSVHLRFFDGSQALLSSNSEISLDTIDAQLPEDGFRTVVLTLAYGDSEHEVQFRHDNGSRYEVKTPTGSGIARGTRFRVAVSDDGAAEYAVQEGRVDVTNANRTVQVAAMQQTTFTATEPPADPAFFVTGEGVVTEMGAIWIVGGQPFAVNEDTLISDNPQIGDLVHVEAHLQDDGPPVADRITLVHPDPTNHFYLTGLVESIGDDAWVIAGQTISVTEATEIDEDIVVGDRVQATGTILPDNGLQAEEIKRLDDDDTHPFAFTGVVQTIVSGTWTISGVDVTITDTTSVEPGIMVGDLVHVEGLILGDGTWLAQDITLVTAGDATFTITGIVDNMDPWVVAGLPFTVYSWTVIDPNIEVGDLVRVNGRILSDGTWVATEIILLDDDDTLLQIVFVGTVDGMDPWVVDGLPLVTNDDSLIDEDIAVGDLVRVTAIIRTDDTWLATRIEKLDTVIEPGCVAITAVVVGINGDHIILSDGQTYIIGEDIVIDGELRVGSVILIVACANDDGTITIISITVIYTPPLPPPPPPGGGGDDGGGNNGSTTICHKPGTPAEKTMTLPESALSGHLGHGDTMGACP